MSQDGAGGGATDLGLGGMNYMPDYIQQHEYVQKSTGVTGERSAFERASYDTGVCYISGVLSGGAIGMAQAVVGGRKLPNFKLKINNLLNNSGRLGSRTGNAFAVFGLSYTLSRSLIKNQRATDDWKNDIGALGIAGVLTGIPRGPASALVVGAACASVGSLYFYAKQLSQEN